MKTTANYGLKLPESSDYISPEAANENANAIDQMIYKLETTKQALINAAGLLKGDGSGGIVAASCGTDYIGCAEYSTHKNDKNNPHGVTAGQAGAEPAGTVVTHNGASDAHSALFAQRAPLNSPVFTGTPIAPTAEIGTTSMQIATTAFVANALGSFSTTPFVAGASAPSNTKLFWIDTGNGGILKYHDGTEWKTVASTYTE